MTTILVPHYTGTLSPAIGPPVEIVDGRGEIEDGQADYFRTRGYRLDGTVDPLGQLTSGAPPARNASLASWASYARSRGIDVTDDHSRGDLIKALDESPWPLDSVPDVPDSEPVGTPPVTEPATEPTPEPAPSEPTPQPEPATVRSRRP